MMIARMIIYSCDIFNFFVRMSGCLNYFFQHCLQKNQSLNWKLFSIVSPAVVEGFNRKPFYFASSDGCIEISDEHSFPWIIMSNIIGHAGCSHWPQSWEVRLTMNRGFTWRNRMYSMVFLKIADLFIFASSPATMFFNSMILRKGKLTFWNWFNLNFGNKLVWILLENQISPQLVARERKLHLNNNHQGRP